MPKTIGRHKAFTRKAREEVEPLSFDLEGQTFKCHPEIPGAVILDFAAASSEGGVEVAIQMSSFFKRAILPEDYENFEKLIYDPEVAIDEELLADILGWLVEQYTDRPTEASSK